LILLDCCQLTSLYVDVVLAGKLAAQVVTERALALDPSVPAKAIQPEIVEAAANYKPRDPIGITGDNAFSFGGGMVLSNFKSGDIIDDDIPRPPVYEKQKPFDLMGTINDNIKIVFGNKVSK